MSIQAIPLPQSQPRTVSILGATGTIGQNSLKLITANADHFAVEALTAKRNATALAEAAKHSHARIAVVEDEAAYAELKAALAGSGIEAAAGNKAILEAASRPVDILVSAIVGIAALAPTLAAFRNGAIIGLANKECLVSAGELVMKQAQDNGTTLLPIDSEHNAIYQCLKSRDEAVERITLTASGGPFRAYTQEQMESVTIEQAIAHPNWNMGAKISVDSATMMNKGLELIEAHYLFQHYGAELDIVVHPESIIHGLVTFSDGATLAGLSPPDMCVPIAYALGWPARLQTNAKRLNLAELGSMSFAAPDEIRFPALRLAREALENGGSAPLILNAANEVAVDAFLNGRIAFLSIAKIVEEALHSLSQNTAHTLDDILQADKQARHVASDAAARYTKG